MSWEKRGRKKMRKQDEGMIGNRRDLREDEREDVRIFVKSRVADAIQAPDEIIAEEEEEAVVREAGVSEPKTEDDEVGEEVGGIEDGLVDEESPEDGGVVDRMVQR
jgi:uncharacterized sporulation protein YeaH/YhbH (DUF444 family)